MEYRDISSEWKCLVKGQTKNNLGVFPFFILGEDFYSLNFLPANNFLDLRRLRSRYRKVTYYD